MACATGAVRTFKPPLTATAPQSRYGRWGERMFEQSRSLAHRIKGLRYAVRLNDFKLAQRLRMALVATLRHLDEPTRDEVARLVDISGLWVRNVGDRHKAKREIEKLARDIVPHLDGRSRRERQPEVGSQRQA